MTVVAVAAILTATVIALVAIDRSRRRHGLGMDRWP